MIRNWLLLTLTIPLCTSWDLDRIVSDNAAVLGVAVWETRAFLTLPRLWRDPRVPACDPVFSQERRHTGPTLIEAPWPEPSTNSSTGKRRRLRRMPQSPRAFPGVSHQVMGDCSSLQSAIGLALDGQRGRLWVLDSGEASCGFYSCTPKVVVFNLRTNQEILVRPLAGVRGEGLSGIALDVVRNPGDTRAYIGYPGGGALIVVSWREKSWWRVRLSGLGAGVPLLPRAAHAPTPSTPGQDVPRWDLAVIKMGRRRPRLVISAGQSEMLFDVFLSDLRDHTPREEERNFVSPQGGVVAVHRMGSKLGPSTGLVADGQGALYYFLVRDAVALRWDPLRGVGAEAHDVLLQDPSQLPLAGAFFLDAAKNVWAVAATFNATLELKALAGDCQSEPADRPGAGSCPATLQPQQPEREAARQDEHSSEETGDWSSEEAVGEEDIELGEVDNKLGALVSTTPDPPAPTTSHAGAVESRRRRRFATWRSWHVRPEDEDDAKDTVIIFKRTSRSNGTPVEVVVKPRSNSSTSLDPDADEDDAVEHKMAPVHCVLLQKGPLRRKALSKK